MKYMGSKRRIVDDIIPVMLGMYDGDTFVDMFCGGCSVIESVPSAFRRIANDKQKYLIEMWKSLTCGKEFPHRIEREFYTRVRDSFNKKDGAFPDDMIGWVGFMGSFNGRFFDGGYSGHDVAGTNGKHRDYISENIGNTLRQVDALKGVEFVSSDYKDVLLPEHSLIYCDIPYKGTKQYLSSKGFDYESFYKWCVDKKNEGHVVFVSEYEMPSEFKCVWQKEVTNSMHQTNTKKSVEKLFTISDN